MEQNPTFLKAAVLYKKNKLDVHELKIPKLKEGQILIKIIYSGACRSQLMEIEGKRGKDIWLPHLLGHEASGIIIKKHKNIKKFKVGDKVILSWLKNNFKDSRKILFKLKNKIINAGPVTTFSNYSIVSSNRVYKLPKPVSFKTAILYGCALPTGYGLVRNQLKPKKNEIILVIGLGGIGLCSIATLAALKINNIIGIDIDDHKLKLAKQLGAKKIINSKKINLRKYIFKFFPRGVDCVIECTGHTKLIEYGFSLLNRETGRLYFASHPTSGEKIKIDPHELITGKKIEGSWGGKTDLSKQILEMHKLFSKSKINLNLLLKKTYKLEEINKVFYDLKFGNVVRPIIKMKH